MKRRERKANRLANFDYGLPGSYFVTLCTHHSVPLFEMEPIVGNGHHTVPFSHIRKSGNGTVAVPYILP